MRKKVLSVISLSLILIILTGFMSFSVVSAETKTSVKLDSKEYDVAVGDEFTYTYVLTTPDYVAFVQASTYYSHDSLQLLEGTAREMFPVLRSTSSVVYNTKTPGVVKFNSLDGVSDGFDFTEGGVLVSLKFKVIADTDSYIYTQLEEMDEFGTGKYYVYGSEVVDDRVSFSEELEGDSIEPPVKNGVLVGSTDYDVTVGDEIAYTYILTTPSPVAFIQASTYYSHDKLQLIEGTSREMFPVLRSNATVVYNTKNPGEVRFNSLDGTDCGFDFTEGAILVSLKFKVLDDTDAYIYTQLEEMDEFGTGKYYVYGSEIVQDGVLAEEDLEGGTEVLPTDTNPSDSVDKPTSMMTYTIGDVNFDADINIKDATAIQKAIAKIAVLTDAESLAGDVDVNGDVNIKDATAIQKYIAGMKSEYPIGSTENRIV